MVTQEHRVWVYKNRLPRTLDEPPLIEFTTERQDRLELYSQTVNARSPEEACAKVEAQHERDAKFIRMDDEVRRWGVMGR